MAENEPKREPLGPGMLILLGVGLLAIGAWCGYDVFTMTEEKAGDTAYLVFNYGGLIGGPIGAVIVFVLAAVRSKKASGK